MRRSLLPFLGDTLSWLTGTATTKNVNSIKTRINQLIATQHNQQETLVHVISILNVTRYAIQVIRQHINIVISTAEKTHQDITKLYNITHSLCSCLSYQQIVLHFALSRQTSETLCTTWEKSPYTPWITLMQQQQEYSHHMYCLWKISEKCYHILRNHFLPPCTYQFHQKMHSISADTYAPTSWLQMKHFYYS